MYKSIRIYTVLLCLYICFYPFEKALSQDISDCSGMEYQHVLSKWANVIQHYGHNNIWILDDELMKIEPHSKVSIAKAYFCLSNPSGKGLVIVRSATTGEAIAFVVDGRIVESRYAKGRF